MKRQLGFALALLSMLSNTFSLAKSVAQAKGKEIFNAVNNHELYDVSRGNACAAVGKLFRGR